MEKVSIICCYNKKNILDDYLDNSINKQNVKVEKVFIDTNKHKFSSASKALNYGASLATGEYYIFAHQDISFDEQNFIEQTIDYVDAIDNGIAGLAGKKIEDFMIYSNMLHGNRKVKAGNYQIENLEEVQTLDEVFIAMKKSTFDKLKFDDKILSNWHLYGVEICLNAGLQGIKSYVMPLESYHLSTGNVDKSFYKELDKVIEKYKRHYDVIATTCVNTKTSVLSYNIYKIKKKAYDKIISSENMIKILSYVKHNILSKK